MKVILSRKGIDSASGLPGRRGRPSPILPGGRLVSIPIFSKKGPACYEDLWLDGTRTYLDLMNELGYGYPRRTRCHCDPDLCKDTRSRSRGWRPMFGQAGNETTHLLTQGVGEDDLFLFFGWFRHAEIDSRGRLTFRPPDLHVIFGYLQVAQVIRIETDTKVPGYAGSHPHVVNRGKRRNLLYLARKTAAWDLRVPGAGGFSYHERLVLTKKGYSRSMWDLPECFRTAAISYHSPRSWVDGVFRSASRGQEFVVQDHRGVERWARSLITERASR